jgi:hypothetical protein
MGALLSGVRGEPVWLFSGPILFSWEILRRVMDEPQPPLNLAAAIRARIAPLGGVDLELPEREPMPALIARADAWLDAVSARPEDTIAAVSPRAID